MHVLDTIKFSKNTGPPWALPCITFPSTYTVVMHNKTTCKQVYFKISLDEITALFKSQKKSYERYCSRNLLLDLILNSLHKI